MLLGYLNWQKISKSEDRLINSNNLQPIPKNIITTNIYQFQIYSPIYFQVLYSQLLPPMIQIPNIPKMLRHI